MNTNAAGDRNASSKMALTHYWSVIHKRKWTILAFALPLVALVTASSFLSKPTYTASGTLLIEKEPNILSFEQIRQVDTFNEDYYQTQYKLLQSRALAGKTIEKLKLYDNEGFAGSLKRAYGATYAPDSAFQRKLTEAFLARLDVSPMSQTRLVEVRFRDPDPKFAAEVLNAFFDAFIDMNVQIKYEASEQAAEFLKQQITNLRQSIAKDEQELGQYGAEKNIITLSNTETTIVDKLGSLNRALTEAQIDRVKKETYYNLIKNVPPESIPEALSNQLIQRLREDYGKLNRQYLMMQERYGPEYPEMQRVKTELESARQSLLSETENLLKGAYSDWQAALQKERSLEEVFNDQKQQAIQLNSNAITYNSLRIEIDNKKNLMAALLKRQSETDVSAQLKELRTSNVRVVDRAEVPLYPSSPKKRLNIALAVLVGLLGGTGLAFLFERLDDSVKDFEDVERYSGLASLGMVPAFNPNGFPVGRASGTGINRTHSGYGVKIKVKKKERGRGRAHGRFTTLSSRENAAAKPRPGSVAAADAARPAPVAGPPVDSIELVTFRSPSSGYSECYRTIRSSLLLSTVDTTLKCIAVSSPLAGEGKTTTLSNLAVTLAQSNKRVLVVDADLRKPRLHRIFKILNANGLSDYLSGKIDLTGLIKPTDVPHLYLLNTGPVPLNPLELLDSRKMGELIQVLRTNFDYILFDTPPILAVTDGLVLGAKLDGLILVVWGEKTPREALKRAKEQLEMAKIRPLGVIINNLVIRKYDYYYQHQYYQYGGKDGASYLVQSRVVPTTPPSQKDADRPN